MTVVGAAGRREGSSGHTFTQHPIAPVPSECDLVVGHGNGASIHDHVELRQARGMFGFNGQGVPSGDGHTLLWARMPEIVLDAGSIALMADYMASAVGNAISTTAHCTSLDNTIRFATDLEPGTSGWILCDTHIDLVAGGIAHGTCHIWSENNLLLAVASQSMTISSITAS